MGNIELQSNNLETTQYTSNQFQKEDQNREEAFHEVLAFLQSIQTHLQDLIDRGSTKETSGNSLLKNTSSSQPDEISVMTYNTRTPDASYPGGDDAGPSNPHYWVNRQQHIVDEMRLPDGSFPTVLNIQEGNGLQIEGGKDPCNPSNPNRIPGLLDLMNQGQPGRYKVLYLKDSSGNDWKDDDAIIYDSSKITPVNAPGANQAVPLESNDKYGQRYAHIAAFQLVSNPDKKMIIGDAHAQKNSAGALTDSDAKAIAKTISEMTSQFKDQSGNPAKAIFTADANRGDLYHGGQGENIQNDLENIVGNKMTNGYDDPRYASDGNTSGLWDGGPGPHGRREDSIWTNGTIESLHQADVTAAAEASDHMPVWAEIQV